MGLDLDSLFPARRHDFVRRFAAKYLNPGSYSDDELREQRYAWRQVRDHCKRVLKIRRSDRILKSGAFIGFLTTFGGAAAGLFLLGLAVLGTVISVAGASSATVTALYGHLAYGKKRRVRRLLEDAIRQLDDISDELDKR